MDKELKARIQGNKVLTSQERNSIIRNLESLGKIKQIFNEWADTGDNADSWAFREIRKVLENDAELTVNTIAELQERSL